MRPLDDDPDAATLASDPDGAERSTASRAEMPTRIGRFEVDRVVGRGAVGIVLAATDTVLGRSVAIKLLAAEPSPRRRAAMIREAQALARLHHPSVVSVHDVGEIEGRIYVAMELVEGESLREVMKGRAASWREWLELYCEAGRGLAAAHRAGVVHGDFKPANVMVGPTGVRVVDFGLARLAAVHDDEVPRVAVDAVARSMAGDASAMGTTVAGAGTPAYMAPELWAGERADTRSDQFAFCVALWEALFHARPFAGDTTAELAQRALAGRLARPQRGGVPRAVASALARGLSVDPAKRWPSMDALLEALTRRRTTRVAGTAAAASIGLLGAWIGLSHEGDATAEERAQALQACLAAVEAAPVVWDEPTRERVEQGLRSAALPYAAQTAERIGDHGSTWMSEWTTARRGLCAAEHTEATLSAEQAERGRSCLEDAATSLGELVEQWARPTTEDVEHAVTRFLALPSPGQCLDPAHLRVLQRLESASPRLRERAEALLSSSVFDIEPRAKGHPPGADPLEGFEESFAEAKKLGLDEYAAAMAVSWLRWGNALELEPGARARIEAHARSAVERLAHDSLVEVYFEMTVAAAESDRGDREAAASRLEGAVGRAEALWGDTHPQTGRLWMNTGIAQGSAGRPDAARRSLRRSVEILERALGGDHPHTVAARVMELEALGSSRADKAAAYEHALRVFEASYGPSSVMVAKTRDNLANLVADTDPDRAEHLRLQAIDKWRQMGEGEWSAHLARSLANLSGQRRSQGRNDEAIALQREALGLLETSLGPEHADTAQVVFLLGQSLADTGDVRGAHALLERLEATYGEEPTPAQQADLTWLRAMILQASGDTQAALNAARAARDLYDGRDDAPKIDAWIGQHER